MFLLSYCLLNICIYMHSSVLLSSLIREASDCSGSWLMKRHTLVFKVLKISECEYSAIDATSVLMLPFKNFVPHLTSYSSFKFINILSYTIFYRFYYFCLFTSFSSIIHYCVYCFIVYFSIQIIHHLLPCFAKSIHLPLISSDIHSTIKHIVLSVLSLLSLSLQIR